MNGEHLEKCDCDGCCVVKGMTESISHTELEKIEWTNNFDSIIDYATHVGMQLVFIFAIIENVRLHYKKSIYVQETDEETQFYI